MPVPRDFYKIFRNLELRYSEGFLAAGLAGRAGAGTSCEIVLMSRYFCGPSYTSTLACLILLLGSSTAMGQDGVARRSRPGEEPADIFLPAPRNLRQQLSRAAKALEEERNSEAVDLLGQLLASPEVASEATEGGADQDYFVAESEADGTQTSLKSQAQQMLGAMNDQGASCTSSSSVPTRQMLEQALDSRDFSRLVEVTRRYFHTLAGYEATMLVGRYYLDQGRPLAAALRFERLVASPVAARLYEPELSVLLATCWLLAEMPNRAGRRWSHSRRVTPKRRFASVTKKCHYSRTTAKRSPGWNNSSVRLAFPWTKRRRSGFYFVATRRGTPRAGGLSAAHGAVACPNGQPSER